jgi:pimeloyl-ACP methyl ester carboxylesterase
MEATMRRHILRVFVLVVLGWAVAACHRSPGEAVPRQPSAIPRPAPDDTKVSHDAPAHRVRYRRQSIDGLQVFYREAGDPDAPTVLLLHGFPSSSHMFRNLIPILSQRYHVVAPDYPGFGFSDLPSSSDFRPSFAAYADIVEKLTKLLRIERYALYIQDYGAPVGLRLALLHPERVTALIVQNGNAYAEGLSDEWLPLVTYWRDPNQTNREKLRAWLTAPGTRMQYVAGVSAADQELFAPETWTLDWALLARPGNIDLQLDLFLDYRTNVELYPTFQEFFRSRKPPTLVVWGRHDPFFTLAGARAYQRDLPDAALHLLDAGHFALETHAQEVAALMTAFLDRQSFSRRPHVSR